MKTNKIIVVTEEFSTVITLGDVWDFPKERWVALMQKTNAFLNKKVLNVADANTHHICKYCGNIVQGTDEDVLCPDCRMTFGHTFYSEL